jgi:hypothetical protein
MEEYYSLCAHINFLYVCKTSDDEQEDKIIDEQHDAAVQHYVQRALFILRVILRSFY